MDNQALTQLDTELKHAGEDTTLSPLMLQLEQLRITPDKQLPKMEFLFRVNGKPCFPRKELVAITGKAKSGKTFVSSMLIACCQMRDVLFFHREQEQPLRVLWYDTEQSDESTQDILKNRILKMVVPSQSPSLFDKPSPPCLLDIFNVRITEWKERRSLLLEAVRMCSPDLVIIDGIRDLVNDINDGVLAQEVMEELMKLASDNQCCIACVLHQNKSGEDHNLRGWIGTELTNKAFEIYTCEKLPHRIFKFEQDNSRKYDWDQKFYFTVNENGLPIMSDAPEEKSNNTRQDKLPQLKKEYIVQNEDGGWQFDVQKLFLDAMHGKEEIGGGELKSEVCDLANICSYKFYNKLLAEALEHKVITKYTRDRLTFYAPAPF
ncbi:AAA domain-containing protein [Prevotella communis]|jgi:archaellum biogenesis ATPase FlaH|uniref:AAA domain-containing protein n=1 Tax=Prevotella communis TaxID=2913614 RepID=A0A1H0IMS2_9BACT|nr:AAA family ATPase [Prevotella communis]SDO32655.1 AAA domain-containing protein [Prevotella communis]